MFSDPLSLTGNTSGGNSDLPRINIDAGLGEFNKYSTDASKKATIKHTSFKAKGAALATDRHTFIVEQLIKRTDTSSSVGYVMVPYKAYIVIEHDSNAILAELAEIVANCINFVNPADTGVLQKLMNKEV